MNANKDDECSKIKNDVNKYFQQFCVEAERNDVNKYFKKRECEKERKKGENVCLFVWDYMSENKNENENNINQKFGKKLKWNINQ